MPAFGTHIKFFFSPDENDSGSFSTSHKENHQEAGMTDY